MNLQCKHRRTKQERCNPSKIICMDCDAVALFCAHGAAIQTEWSTREEISFEIAPKHDDRIAVNGANYRFRIDTRPGPIWQRIEE